MTKSLSCGCPSSSSARTGCVCCLVRLHANSRATFYVESLFMSIHPALSSFEDFCLLEHKWLVGKISFSKIALFFTAEAQTAHHYKQIFLSNIKCQTKTVKFCHKIVPLIIPVILYDFREKKLWITETVRSLIVLPGIIYLHLHESF